MTMENSEMEALLMRHLREIVKRTGAGLPGSTSNILAFYDETHSEIVLVSFSAFKLSGEFFGILASMAERKNLSLVPMPSDKGKLS